MVTLCPVQIWGHASLYCKISRYVTLELLQFFLNLFTSYCILSSSWLTEIMQRYKCPKSQFILKKWKFWLFWKVFYSYRNKKMGNLSQFLANGLPAVPSPAAWIQAASSVVNFNLCWEGLNCTMAKNCAITNLVWFWALILEYDSILGNSQNEDFI